MKLPGFLLIGLPAIIIIAVDALEISTTEPPKTIDEYKRICFYWNNFQYLPGKAKFFPEDMDTSLFTHGVYAIANMSDNFTIIPSDSNDDGPGGMYERFNNMKKNSNVVTLLEIAVFESSDLVKLSAMLRTNATRQQFIKSSMDFVRERDFDGLVLVLFYPGYGPSPPEDKGRFTLLLKEMSTAVEHEANKTGKPKLLITATFLGERIIIDNAYELSKIHQYLDWLNVAAYDFHNDSRLVTQHHSPLFPINNTDEEYTVEGVAEYYASKGVPKDKMIIGMTPFARGFILKNADNNGIGAPTVGPWPAGEYTQELGKLAYYEICPLLNDNSVTKVRIEDAKVSYLYNGTLWVGYDDQTSMAEKASWVKDNGYGGWYVFTSGFDDFNGTFCNQGRYPLIRTISDTLMGCVTGSTTVHENS